MKGIVLAGGSGSRLWPLTKGVSKQLLPIYDKPMVYYPLSQLMLAGIREILLITTPHDQQSFIQLLGDGSSFGVSISYKIQAEPKGLAQAITLGEGFIAGEGCALILGDNIFYGQGLGLSLKSNTENLTGGKIFAYQVDNPSDFGIVEFDTNGKAISIEEKPEFPKTNFAVPGLYFYDNSVVSRANSLKPSPRGELEITDLNLSYLKDNQLVVEVLPRGTAWLDTGTPQAMTDASEFIRIVEKRQGLKIACLEEIAFSNGWITKSELIEFASRYANSDYGKYLLKIVH
jgi:glucose-1-phosphate thymidylyltransferase